MKELPLSVDVKCLDAPSVQGRKMKVVMIPFTGKGYGEYFNGEIIGTGCDTQKITNDGRAVLSARYMLEGTDRAGQKCRIFIENTVHDENGWHPVIVTDSGCLAEWETLDLTATVDPAPEGVLVRIYREV